MSYVAGVSELEVQLKRIADALEDLVLLQAQPAYADSQVLAEVKGRITRKRASPGT